MKFLNKIALYAIIAFAVTVIVMAILYDRGETPPVGWGQ